MDANNIFLLLLVIGLFAGILLFVELGLRFGWRQKLKASPDQESKAGIVDGTVFTLLGLLIGFTFSGAMSRFEVRKQIIVEEANIIGTAYLRLDLLTPEAQPELKNLFRNYTELRTKMFDHIWEEQTRNQYFREMNRLQMEIWSKAQSACQKTPNPAATMLLLPALNAMIDVTTTRYMSIINHVPVVILVMLYILSFLASFMVGMAMSARPKRSILHILLFALTLTVSIAVIFDLEYPRVGIIRLDWTEQALHQLLDTMK